MKIGPHDPPTDPKTKIYVGYEASLKGKAALVSSAGPGDLVVAQFDDKQTGFGFGWWKFGADQFEDLK